ncbi:MAG TPA: 3-oxoacid CoA-transferase subunit A [Candidatus Sulfotelmatobacter sp.]|jgi:acetate CoA/acetoacetate CoA-transferase alpha subunit|nr:3-oxoacid CoA-transferase subunit A [Candidatus Sulfotelmatobacter sp.]
MSNGKVIPIDEALSHVRSGIRLMLGEFVGAGQPAKSIEWIVDRAIDQLTLIVCTPGYRDNFLMGRLFETGLVKELISSHTATSSGCSDAYLAGTMLVRQLFPMGTWAEKVRAGGMGLGGILVPVGVGILDQPGIFPELKEPKQKISLNGQEYFVEEALRADVSIIRGWRADPLGNVEFRHTGVLNQCDIAMAGAYTIAEVNEIVPVGAIPPDRVGCAGIFVDAVVQGYSLAEQDRLYRKNWTRLGILQPEEGAAE